MTGEEERNEEPDYISFPLNSSSVTSLYSYLFKHTVNALLS